MGLSDIEDSFEADEADRRFRLAESRGLAYLRSQLEPSEDAMLDEDGN